MGRSLESNTTHYCARAFAWSISTDDDQIGALFDQIFADLRVPPAASSVHLEILRVPESSSLVLQRDDQRSTHVPAELVDQVVGIVNEGVRATSDTLDLHAAALTDPDETLIVVATAPSGGGKTTLAANLCCAGWSYLSDETIGVDFTNGSLVGDIKPLTVKRGLHETLDIDLVPLTLDEERQQRWYVRPDSLGGSLVTHAAAPTDLVFTTFDPSLAVSEVERIAPHHALRRLFSSTFRLEDHGPRILPTLARLVARSRLWELRCGDGADAVAQLLATIAGSAQPDREVVSQPLVSSSDARLGPAPAPGTVFAGFPSLGGVVHHVGLSEVIELDPIGALVWQLLDGMVSIADLAIDLASHFAVAHDIISADLHELCNELIDRRFLITPREFRSR